MMGTSIGACLPFLGVLFWNRRLQTKCLTRPGLHCQESPRQIRFDYVVCERTISKASISSSRIID